MPVWDYPHTLLSDRGAQLTVVVAREAYKLMGDRKKFTGAYHPMTDGLVERLNHTVNRTLPFVVVDLFIRM
ncbi:unnamed protein product [Discosporangium mesarthrocarpum]